MVEDITFEQWATILMYFLTSLFAAFLLDDDNEIGKKGKKVRFVVVASTVFIFLTGLMLLDKFICG